MLARTAYIYRIHNHADVVASSGHHQNRRAETRTRGRANYPTCEYREESYNRTGVAIAPSTPFFFFPNREGCQRRPTSRCFREKHAGREQPSENGTYPVRLSARLPMLTITRAKKRSHLLRELNTPCGTAVVSRCHGATVVQPTRYTFCTGL